MPDQLNTQYFADLHAEQYRLTKALDHLQDEEGRADDIGTPYSPATLLLRDEGKRAIVRRILAIQTMVDQYCNAFEIQFFPLSNEN